jgi:hypothetical protein
MPKSWHPIDVKGPLYHEFMLGGVTKFDQSEKTLTLVTNMKI